MTHLAGGPIRERNRGNPPRGYANVLYQVGDAVRDHTSLAAARPRDDEQRAIDVLDGLALGWVQPFKKGPLCLLGHTWPIIALGPPRLGT
jgi:hypothetical protein